jgi:hypothetical protein
VPTGTADISAVIPRGLLPFPSDSAPRPPVDRPVSPQEPPPPSSSAVFAPPPVARPPQRLAGTADISAFVPRAATPFTPTAPSPQAQPQQPAPRKRLIRFDPQTGQPLPAPIWVDLPPEAPSEKK